MPVQDPSVVADMHKIIRVDRVAAHGLHVLVRVAQHEQDAGLVALDHCVDARRCAFDVGIVSVITDQIHAELIETGIAKPADVPEFGRKIHVEASRMIQLVNDILQLSHLDSVSETHAQPDMETVDLLDVAKDCVERQKLNAQRSFISLTYLGESARVLGNRDQLDELCQNLCDNAIRYNRPGGKVQLITSCTRDGHCTLTVKDNGIGIPKDAQSSVFERFYRVDKSRSKATGGTGLGLAIVKHIARIHNARIKLESEVNVGTTITVVFETAH